MCRIMDIMPLALLFIASAMPIHAQGPAPEAAAPPPAPAAVPAAAPASAAPALELAPGTILVYYDVKHNLTLTCPLKANTGSTYEWKKNGTVVSAVSELQNRYELSLDNSQLSIKDRRSREEDYGEYTCATGGEVATFDVRGRTRLSLPPDTNVVEGQKLKMQCKVTGKPYPARVEWFYSADATINGTLVGERAVLASSEQGVAGAELVLEAATREDAGRYECRAPAVPGAAPLGAPPTAPSAATTLRVKDMYAALWPFLGICAEVFVLCAIILVYEKRRTKPEMEDSDTDNHEQKKS